MLGFLFLLLGVRWMIEALLVFAGIWALMQGITDIIRAFQIRRWVAEG